MTDFIATRSGTRTRVKLSTGWTITHSTDTEFHAEVSNLSIGVNAVSLEATTPATVESLLADLFDYVDGIDRRPAHEWCGTSALQERLDAQRDINFEQAQDCGLPWA